MNEDKIIKWLVVAVVIVGFVLFGLYAYTQDWIGVIKEKLNPSEKYILTDGAPEISLKSVSADPTILKVGYTRGLIDEVTETELILVLFSSKKNEGGEKKIVWKLDDKTTAGCMNDLVTDNDGTVRRMSEMYINYKNTDQMILPIGWDKKWIKEKAKKGQPAMVFGDDTSTIARTVYLYMDKCE